MVNPRKEYGYWSTSLSPDIVEVLDEIKKDEFLKTRAGALRHLIARYKKGKSSSEVKRFGSEKVYIFEESSFINGVMGACYGEVFSSFSENVGRFCVVEGIA